MRGIDGTSGKVLEGIAHLKQSVRDILTTPIGARVMRPEYGSKLFQLLDRPVSEALIIDLIAATAEALQRWEPRLEVKRVRVESVKPGSAMLTIEGLYKPDGQDITLEGIEI